MGEKKFERQKRIIAKLRMIDDIFFQKIFEDLKASEEILRVCLEDPELEVLEVTPQKELKNLQGRSVRLDVYCRLGNGTYVNVEVQRADQDDHVRRVRYNGACLTVNVTDTGIHFRQVPDVCIIYITQFDLFGRGKTMYHAQKVIQETGDVIKDGLREIYLNTEVDDGSLQAALMQNFMKEEMADQRFPEVSRRFHDLKHDEKEVVPMCKELEQYLAEGHAEGHAEGEAEGKAFVARNLFRAGMSIEEIAKMVGMTAEVVRQWLDLKKTEL